MNLGDDRMCDVMGPGSLIPTCALADLFYLDRGLGCDQIQLTINYILANRNVNRHCRYGFQEKLRHNLGRGVYHGKY